MQLYRRLKIFYNSFISLQGEPKKIARGMALGVFIGVTPTIPFHTALIILIGLILKLNLAAAYLGSWVISNPLTIPIFYFGQYELGRYLLGMPAIQLSMVDFSLPTLFSLGWRVCLPLLTGGIVMAPLFAIPAYFITHRLIVAMRRRSQS